MSGGIDTLRGGGIQPSTPFLWQTLVTIRSVQVELRTATLQMPQGDHLTIDPLRLAKPGPLGPGQARGIMFSPYIRLAGTYIRLIKLAASQLC
jgi:hypothetical protein